MAFVGRRDWTRIGGLLFGNPDPPGAVTWRTLPGLAPGGIAERMPGDCWPRFCPGGWMSGSGSGSLASPRPTRGTARTARGVTRGAGRAGSGCGRGPAVRPYRGHLRARLAPAYVDERGFCSDRGGRDNGDPALLWRAAGTWHQRQDRTHRPRPTGGAPSQPGDSAIRWSARGLPGSGGRDSRRATAPSRGHESWHRTPTAGTATRQAAPGTTRTSRRSWSDPPPGAERAEGSRAAAAAWETATERRWSRRAGRSGRCAAAGQG